VVPSTRLAASLPIDYCPKPRPPQLHQCSAPCPTKIQIISCASPIDTIDTSPKLFALYFSSGWFQARILFYLIVSTTMQGGIFTTICAFFFLFEKNIAEKFLDGKVSLLLPFLFKGWVTLQLKDSEMKVSFGFSAP